MSFFSRLNPVGGIADFWHEFRRPNPYRWPILGASALITGGLFYSFTSERTYIPPPKPDVEYITSFAPDRSDAEIIAGNIENQKRKDALFAREERVEERKRDLYRTLGRATGMDVDQIEAEGQAERAREEAAAQQAHDELMGRSVADTAE